MLLLMCEL